jgi:hypothetical protein
MQANFALILHRFAPFQIKKFRVVKHFVQFFPSYISVGYFGRTHAPSKLLLIDARPNVLINTHVLETVQSVLVAPDAPDRRTSTTRNAAD